MPKITDGDLEDLGAEDDEGGIGIRRSGHHGSVGRSIPDRVAQFYYALGLICSSYSVSILIVTLSLVLLCCYPLLSLPWLPGNNPQIYVTSDLSNAESQPKWLGTKDHQSQPAVIIQQIIVKSSVLPWNEELILADSFRGPLSTAFELVQLVQNSSLSAHCLQIGKTQSPLSLAVLPQNQCLLLSPVNFWEGNYTKFLSDPDLLSTVLNSRGRTRTGISELFLGMSLKESGIKRWTFRAKERVINYALTLVLKDNNPEYISFLKSTVENTYPRTKLAEFLTSQIRKNFTPLSKAQLSSHENKLTHIYYPSQLSIQNFIQLIPILIAYGTMFVYVYFSMSKVDLIKSKFGVSLAAVLVVVASWFSSIGIWRSLNVNYEINWKTIFPYLLVVIGLENVLVLTKSVVSTASNLDVKIRVAQGLSKEGWSITKNLFAEITILTIGFFTFIPMIQEFCVMTIIGLLSDFFLQTFFFATVLSIDVQRSEFGSGIHHHHTSKNKSKYFQQPIHPKKQGIIPVQNGFSKSNGPSSKVIVAPSPYSTPPIITKLPKRLRLLYFWAKTRFFQRTFIICMVGWVGLVGYESGIMPHLISYYENTNSQQETLEILRSAPPLPLPLPQLRNQNSPRVTSFLTQNFTTPHPPRNSKNFETNFDYQNFKIAQELLDPLSASNPIHSLSPSHWQILLGIYNYSITGKYITLLPPITISIPVSPETTIKLRHPIELEESKKFNWQGLLNQKKNFDVWEEFEDKTPSSQLGSLYSFSSWEDPYIPSSPFELTLAVLLAIPSLIFISYTLVVFYKCICSRNYAEWRSSWMKGSPFGAFGTSSSEYYTQVIFEAVPLVLDGHSSDVECFSSDGNNIVSVCLGGELKVWNGVTGDNIVSINRRRYFANQQHLQHETTTTGAGSDGDDSSSLLGSSPPTSTNERLFRSMSTTSAPLGLVTPLANGCYYPPPSGHRRTSSFPVNVFPQNGITPTSSSGFYSSGGTGSCVSLSSDVRPESQSSIYLERIHENYPAPPPVVGSVWCLETLENLVVVGTGTGTLEIWDGWTGSLLALYNDESGAGIMCLKLIGNGSFCILGRINGTLDFFEIGGTNPNGQLNLNCVQSIKAHQQPITVLDSEGGRVLTGSQDHTIKVFRLEDSFAPVYTLHGHYGPITVLFIDKICPMNSGSGSQDGLLCVWDLVTGTCMYSIQAHDGPIHGLTYSDSYIISSGGGGGDEKICVWERFQGHLLNTISSSSVAGSPGTGIGANCSSLVMLTHNLLISSRQGSLVVWDVRTGDVVREVRLGHRDSTVFVKQIMNCADGLLCDYGSQLRLVRFPSLINKLE